MKLHCKPLLSLFCILALVPGFAGCAIRPISAEPEQTGGPAGSVVTPVPTEAPAPEAGVPFPGPDPTPPPEETPVALPEGSAPETHVIELNGHSALLDGDAVAEYDYTWHCDPSVSHDEVKNAPAEYYTGSAPSSDAAVYIDSNLPYFPELPESGFRPVNYDGEQEWAYYYTDGEHDGFIFATLPHLGSALPADMMHSEAEAAENRVLHITQPGVYALEGVWQGQIRVELGDADEVFADESARVTVILNGADIACSVAPGLLFASVYECDNAWESRESSTFEADTSDAGVTLLLADGTENSVTGCNICRMLKTKYKEEISETEIPVQKKQRKLDGALYSCVSMQIGGSGSLTVTGSFEGLDSELHLTILDGRIEIRSQDDGINVNEDHVSVVRFAGGTVTIYPALGEEGDGVDSNGFIVLDGGALSVNGVRPPDSALDSEDGVTYRGGTLILDGEVQSLEVGSVFREIGGGPGEGMGGGGFPGMDGFGGFAGEFDLQEFKEQVAALPDDASLEDVLALFGFGGGEGRPGEPGGFPGEDGGGDRQPPEGRPR